MASTNLTIKVHYSWEPDQADGSECFCCGVRCYLFMSRLVVSLESTGKKLGTTFVACQSCSIAIADDFPLTSGLNKYGVNLVQRNGESIRSELRWSSWDEAAKFGEDMVKAGKATGFRIIEESQNG